LKNFYQINDVRLNLCIVS